MTPPAPYEWIRWLSGMDAAVLLMYVCQCIEDPQVDHAAVVQMVQGWRRNAERALTADDWKATVDSYVEVMVDARLYYFSRDKREREELDEPQENNS